MGILENNEAEINRLILGIAIISGVNENLYPQFNEMIWRAIRKNRVNK